MQKDNHKRRGCGCCLGRLIQIAVIVLVLWLTRGWWLPWLGHRLVVSTPLQKADAIYVYAGGENERPRHAAMLLRGGWAPEIITGSSEVTSNMVALGLHLDEAHMNAWALMRQGVPAVKIIMLPGGTSTFEETIQLRDFAEKKGMRRIILVSSPFHMRRVYLTARKVFKGSRVELVYSPCESARINLDAWWKEEYSLITIEIEYAKLAFYHLKYL